MLALQGTSNLGGDVVLWLLSESTNYIIFPCFVFLTASWYGDKPGNVPIRMLLWASGGSLLWDILQLIVDAAASRNSSQVLTIVNIVLAILCILLSSYAFSLVDTPGFASWSRSDPKGRSLGHKPARPYSASVRTPLQIQISVYMSTFLLREANMRPFLQLFQTLAQPTAWFIFGFSFFRAASVPLATVLLPKPGSLAQLAELVFIPFLIALVLVYIIASSFPGSCGTSLSMHSTP